MTTTARNIVRILAGFQEHRAPHMVATMNDWAVKIARLEGEYIWHAHHETDEVFLVIDGMINVAVRAVDGSTTVTRNAMTSMSSRGASSTTGQLRDRPSHCAAPRIGAPAG